MVVVSNNSSFQLARCMLNFRGAGIKKLESLCMAIINSNEKNLSHKFGNDFYFQNEEFSLYWTGRFLHM